MDYNFLLINTSMATLNMVLLHMLELVTDNKTYKESLNSQQGYIFFLSFIGWPIFFAIIIYGVIWGFLEYLRGTK